MELFKSIRDSGNVPEHWRALPGATKKDNIKDWRILKELRTIKSGVWKKVYSKGIDGSDIHYFQHESGWVFNVKIKRY